MQAQGRRDGAGHLAGLHDAEQRGRRAGGLAFLWMLALAACVAAAPAARIARAQSSTGVPPATVPVMLGTRDPSAISMRGARGSAPIITSAAKPSASAAQMPATAAAPSDPHANVKVKGLKGTLNKDDIHQAMEARQAELDTCIELTRRTVRWVSGAMRFAFKVDAEGHVAEVHPTISTVGHRELEQCVATIVAATTFPKPAGRATAEFSWGMSVEPVSARPFDSANPKIMASLVRRHAGKLFHDCELRRRRARFQITAYLTADGRVLSAGAVSVPASADAQVDCVLEQFAKWHMPKLKRTSKVSFELR